MAELGALEARIQRLEVISEDTFKWMRLAQERMDILAGLIESVDKRTTPRPRDMGGAAGV